jgi:hypothetical protein
VSDAPKVDPKTLGQKEEIDHLHKEIAEVKESHNFLEIKLQEAGVKVAFLQTELN